MIDRFYVYSLCFPNGEAFYIGKGNGSRKDFHTWEVKRNLENNSYFNYGNKYKKRTIRKILLSSLKPLVVIIKKNLTNEEAIELERAMIKKIGRDRLTNLTDGGEGTEGFKKSLKESKKQSSRQKKAIIRYDPFSHVQERFDSVMDFLKIHNKDAWELRVLYRCCRGEFIQLNRKLYFYESEFNKQTLEDRLKRFNSSTQRRPIIELA